jgi:hypothetical protein
VEVLWKLTYAVAHIRQFVRLGQQPLGQCQVTALPQVSVVLNLEKKNSKASASGCHDASGIELARATAELTRSRVGAALSRALNHRHSRMLIIRTVELLTETHINRFGTKSIREYRTTICTAAKWKLWNNLNRDRDGKVVP